MKNIHRQASDLLGELLPEQLRPYVVLRSELPDSCRGGDGLFVGAIVHPTLDLIVKPMLADRGLWRGRRPAIMVDLADCQNCDLGTSKVVRIHAFRSRFWGLLLHEVAHIVHHPPEMKHDDEAHVQAATRAIASVLCGEFEPLDGPRYAVPWNGHDAAFIRLLIHIVYRANRFGVLLACSDACDLSFYALSSVWKFVVALGDEPEQMQSVPICDVLQGRAPRAFSRLWRLDVEKWAERQCCSAQQKGELLAACDARSERGE